MLKKFYPTRLSELWYHNEEGNTILYSDSDLRLQNYNLNDIGSIIWENCNGELSNKDIASLIYEELDGEIPIYKKVESDVNEYLNELRIHGLVNWEGEEVLDILLVVPPYPGVYSSKAINTPEYSAPPLGVAYIAAILKNNDYTVSIFDMHINSLCIEDIIKEYRKSNPPIVAITATTPTFPNAIRILKLLKAWDETIVTVIGGPHATSLPEECIMSDAVDYVVIGEGEVTILELTNAILKNKKNLQQVNGIVYKDAKGKIVSTEPQPRIKDLDILPFPARELLDIESYYQKGSIVSSRGCPYNCNYCACSVIAGHTYRVHSTDYVLDEIEYLIKEYDFKYFDFHDDTFNLFPSRVLEFCNKIEERSMMIKWGCFCRVNNFNLEIAQAMKGAGCEVIQFGVEAGNQAVLDSIKKKIKLKEVENAIKAASQAGIKQIACGFIIGHANDTEETTNQTIDFGVKLAKLGATRLTISVLTPYPGTDVYINRNKNGIKLISEDWEQYIFSRVVIETENLSKERLREIYTKGVYEFSEATN